MNTTTGYADRGATVSEPFHRRVSWGAIIAGAIMALAVQMVLSLLGAGIGLSAADPLHYNSPDAATYGMGAAIWWAVSSMISLFAGGWFAGHLAGSPNRTDAALHGLVTWGLATILAAYVVASSVSSAVKGGASVVGAAGTAAVGGMASAAGPAKDAIQQQLQANGISMDSLKSQAQQLLTQTGQPALQPDALKNQANAATQQLNGAAENTGSPQAQQQDLQTVVQRVIASGSDTVQQADKDALVNVVMARNGMSRQDAQQRVDQWVTTYQQARAKLAQAKEEAEAKAREMAQKTAEATAHAAIGAVIALLLGALAAGLGGFVSGRRYVVSASAGHVPRDVYR